MRVQLANAIHYDLEDTELSEINNIDPRRHEWTTVQTTCSHLAPIIFDRACEMEAKRSRDKEISM